MKFHLSIISCSILILCESSFAYALPSTNQMLLPSANASIAANHVAPASMLNLPPVEDIQILKDMFKNQMMQIDLKLNQAETFTFQLADKGFPITQKECETYEALISKNYTLHSFEDSDHQEKVGIKLCPPSQGGMVLFNGAWISTSTVKYYFSNKPMINLLNVKGASLLNIEYKLFNDDTMVFRQYIMDEKFKMIQFIEALGENGHRHWSSISALDTDGNVLSKREKHWSNPNEPYLWKRHISFIPAQGDMAKGTRYYQNDGKSIEVARTSYLMPYNWKWDAYEVSPYTVIGGLYKVGDKITDWPDKQANLDLYTKPAASCGEGYIGFEQGNFIRVFGNIDGCMKEMDVSTTHA